MADNPTVNGIVVATDDRGGAHVQRVLPAGAATASSGTLSVTTSASPLIGADGNRRGAIVRNPSSSGVTVYVGTTSGLTTSNGLPIDPGETFTTEATVAIYFVAASAVTIRYWTEGD